MEPSNGNLILLHEAKARPAEIGKYAIVEAFGRRSCPKLVEQVSDADIGVRCNALEVLCDEVRNPVKVAGCVEAGVVGVLHGLLGEPHVPTRTRASEALKQLAKDSGGRREMIERGSASALLDSISDEEPVVRRNVLQTLLSFADVLEAVHALVDGGYPAILIEKAASEVMEIKPLAIALAKRVMRVERGLETILECKGVEICNDLLRSESEAVRREAAAALGSMCFAGSAKLAAIGAGAVARLVPLLSDGDWRVRADAAGALMAICTEDEGKRAVVPAGGIAPTIALLADDRKAVRLNGLKVVASVAVYPQARAGFLDDPSCLERIDAMVTGDDPLLAKHAAIAKDMVLWTP